MKRFLAICLLSIFAGYIYAQPSEADFLLLQKDFVLHPDGSSDMHCRQIIKYNTHMSFNRLYGETFIVYNPKHQKLTINESYTVQASGKKIIAPANSFNEVLPRFASNAPAYNHLREMVVTHTGLELGATGYLDYTLHTDAGYDNELDKNLTVQEDSPVKEYRVSVTLPDGKKLSYKTHLLKEQPQIVKKNGKTSYSWVFRNIAASSKDMYQPADGSNAPHLTFSTRESSTLMMQQLAERMKGNTSKIKTLIDKVSGQGSDMYEQATKVYDYVLNDVVYTPVPAGYYAFKPRGAEETVQSAYGTEMEKTVLLLAMLENLGLTAKPVAIYPSYIDGTVPSLDALTGFAVNISAYGNNYILSPTELTSISLASSKPAYRYTEISQAPRELNPATDNSLDMNMTVDIEKASAKTQSRLSLTGVFNPLLPMLFDKDKTMALLTAGSTEKSDVAEQNGTSASLTLDGKLTGSESSGYYTFVLPEVRGGANSWNMRYLGASRKSDLAIPYPVKEKYSYTVKLPEGMQFASRAVSLVKENKCGKVNIVFEDVSSSSMKITRSIQLFKTLFKPAEYADFAELMRLWANDNYRMTVVKQ